MSLDLDSDFDFDTDSGAGAVVGATRASVTSPSASPVAADDSPDNDDSGPCPFLTHPITDAIIADDPDSLIEAYQDLKAKGDQLYAVQIAIRTKLAAMTEGQSEAKTRRVQGRRHKVKVEMPSPGWDQSILKEAWNSYPALRDQVLKIDTVGVKAREWKKLAETAGAPDLETFRDMVKSAIKPPSGVPTITVEQ
jgi:hypothetical protein